MNPMSAVRRCLALFLILVFLSPPLGKASAQTEEDVQHFPETGHNVRGDFLRFYKSAYDPTLVYGYPITEQFTSRDGKLVQYFQRARFELTPSSAGGASVRLTSLGEALHGTGNQRLDIDNPSACKRFQTGYSVCFAFLDFFEGNGGAAQFGEPISAFEFQDHLIVQYFEKARFEWHADLPEGKRVVLTDLGRIYFERLGEDQTHLKPIRPLDATISPILSIRARAFVKKAITLSSGQQTVYVVVQSQTSQPVAGAKGRATIRFSDGQTEDYYFTTNSSGLGSVAFSFANQERGELVPIELLVTYQGLFTKTMTSFRVWY
jgi:hypothetical protein